MTATTAVKPWYRQFWPWFLIALPGTVVVAALYTVYLAFQNADAVVVDDYYTEGRAINVSLALDNRARELDLSAAITVDRVSGEVLVTVRGDPAPAEAMTFHLFHPASAELDQTVTLRGSGDGRYRGDLDSAPATRYHLRLQPHDSPQWRLDGQLDFRQGEQVTLVPFGGR
ncbi:MAG: FixH family protein [Bacteroidales bacterium]|nr:FixH family protein [Bacteroidales bacterium]